MAAKCPWSAAGSLVGHSSALHLLYHAKPGKSRKVFE
jgi:hypothetical protein